MNHLSLMQAPPGQADCRTNETSKAGAHESCASETCSSESYTSRPPCRSFATGACSWDVSRTGRRSASPAGFVKHRRLHLRAFRSPGGERSLPLRCVFDGLNTLRLARGAERTGGYVDGAECVTLFLWQRSRADGNLRECGRPVRPVENCFIEGLGRSRRDDCLSRNHVNHFDAQPALRLARGGALRESRS